MSVENMQMYNAKPQEYSEKIWSEKYHVKPKKHKISI